METVIQRTYYPEMNRRNQHVRNEIYSFIDNDYLKSEFGSQNYIEFDKANGEPAWVVIYVHFRGGLPNLKEYLR